jgi:hypothetical protein
MASWISNSANVLNPSVCSSIPSLLTYNEPTKQGYDKQRAPSGLSLPNFDCAEISYCAQRRAVRWELPVGGRRTSLLSTICWLLLPYAQSSVTHSRDSPTPIFQVRPTNVRVLTNVTPSTATPNFRFLFHNSTSSDYVCLIVCGCGCTYAGGRTENQILGGLCTMWQTATLQWMGCASMYDSCLI